MQLRHRAALDGIELDELDPRIVIQGVSTAAGKTSMTAVSLFGRDGQRITGVQRDTLDVEVKFGLLIRKEDMAARSELLEIVNGWAAAALYENGGAWLTVNYKTGRKIHVVLAEAAEEGDLKEWTNTFDLTFRAYGVPYWQDAEPGKAAQSGITSAWSGALTVNGNIRTVADVTIKNESGAQLNVLSVSVGGRTMSFSSLGMAADETLVIDHDDEGMLRIRIRSGSGIYRSAMAARNGTSADDFYVMPGTQAVLFSALRSCSVTATATGRYL